MAYSKVDDQPPVMVALLDAVQRVRPSLIVGASLAIVALVAIGDVITGRDISFSAFYLLPVVLTTSGVGARTGIRVAIVTSLSWMLAEVAGHEDPLATILVPLWNVGIRFVVFALVVTLLDALTATVNHERALSREDSLSGLPNARSFYESAEHERASMARHGDPLTIAYIDIDDFKVVNDTLGHSAGDLLLRSTAHTIRSAIRDVDVAARLGGDEFAILLPRTDGDASEMILRRLHHALALEAATNGWPIGYSIGSVTFKSAPTSVDAMVSRSDELMYEVKKSGKNAIRAVTAA